MKKRNYLNNKIVRLTMELLSDYKNAHPESKTPLHDAVRDLDQPESERPRFALAAKRLGWNVTKSQGHIYENGLFIW